MTIQVEQITDVRSFLSLHAEWEDLRERSAGANLFLSHAWIVEWFRHYGEGVSPHILVAREGADWVGAVPLVMAVTHRRGMSVRTLRFPVNLESGNLRGDFLLAERGHEVVSAFVEHLGRTSDRWDCWDLAGLPGDSPAFRYLYGLLEAPYRTTTWSPRQILYYLPVSGNWEDYLYRKGRTFRKKIRNYINRLNQAGSPDFVRYETPERIREGWEVVSDLEARSSKAVKEGCIRLEGAVRDFHRAIADALGRTDNYQIDVLTVNRKAAACWISLRERGTLCSFFTCSDPAFLHVSPARVLVGRVLEDAWAGNFRMIDFNGETRFLRTWTTECRILLECKVYNKKFHSRLAWFREQIAAPAVRRARSGIRPWIPLTPLPARKSPAGRESQGIPVPLRHPSCAFYENGRSALDLGLDSLPLQRGDEILFPSYYCGSELEVLLRKGFRIRYYDVPLNLEVTPGLLDAALTGETRAAYIIHYLGFPQDVIPLSVYCRQKNLLLIEDCAHALYGADPNRPIGRHGDLSIFSLWKFLPIWDGGAAVLNHGHAKHAHQGARREWRDGLQCRLETSIRRRQCGTSWGDAAIELGCRGASSIAYRLNLVPKVSRTREMTGESLDLLRRIDHREVATSRRRNYLALLDALSASSMFHPLFPSLGEDVVPLLFPLLTENPLPFIDAMRNAGVEATVLWKFIHPAVPANRFHDAAYLKSRLVVLPVHQDLTEENIITMKKAAAPFLDVKPAMGDTRS